VAVSGYFDVNDSATAESVRRKLRDPALAPLFNILAEHRAALKCQFDAFAEYVAGAEKHGVEKLSALRVDEGDNRESGEEGKIFEILCALRGRPGGLRIGDC
jgi:hypothetical protein